MIIQSWGQGRTSHGVQRWRSKLCYTLLTHRSAELSLLASPLFHGVLGWSGPGFDLQVGWVERKSSGWPFISWTLLLEHHVQPWHTAELCLLCSTQGKAGAAWTSSNKASFLWSSLTGKAASVRSQSFPPLWTQVTFGSEILDEHPRHPVLALLLGREVSCI